MDRIAGPRLVAVDATTGGKLLEGLLGGPLKTGLLRLALIPSSGATIHWALSSAHASASSPVVPLGGIDMPSTKASADRLVFFANPPASMTVLQFG